MGEYNFKKDLKIGNIGESHVIDYLVSKGGKLVTQNNDNKYDAVISYNNENITYEIKTDVFCAPGFDTGNIFIEIESRDKISGISVTKAKWFVTYFIYLNEMWFIKTENLRKVLADGNFNIVEDSGDINSNTKGYLINRKEIEKHFKIIK
jgi:hypothetical protein